MAGGVSRNNKKTVLSRLLSTNPMMLGIAALIILGVILYVVQSVSSEANDIFNMYDLIGNVRKDSKTDFDKRLFYITMNADGTKSVKVGFSSEIEEEQSSRAAEEAGTGLGEQGPGNWNGAGLAMNAMDMYDAFKFNGKGAATSIHVNDVYLYTGMPWNDDNKWNRLNQNSVNDYLEKNLGVGLRKGSAFHTDDNNGTTPRTIKGVKCAVISWMPIFSFINSKDTGVLDGWSGSIAESGYGVVILEKNDQTFYLPVCGGTVDDGPSHGDNKGHIWPGGLVQTYIGSGTKLNKSTGDITINSGRNQNDITLLKWGSAIMHNKTIPLSEFQSDWKKVASYDGTNLFSAGHPQFTVETNSIYQSGFSGYAIKGFIMHKNGG